MNRYAPINIERIRTDRLLIDDLPQNWDNTIEKGFSCLLIYTHQYYWFIHTNGTLEKGPKKYLFFFNSFWSIFKNESQFNIQQLSQVNSNKIIIYLFINNINININKCNFFIIFIYRVFILILILYIFILFYFIIFIIFYYFNFILLLFHNYFYFYFYFILALFYLFFIYIL